MSTGKVLPISELPTLITGRRAPMWWGMLLLVLIESTVFGTLITAYAYLRAGASEWPPPGIEMPGLLLPGINTVVLFLSSVAVYWGSRGIQRGDQRQLKIGLIAGVLLEVAFFSVKMFESRSMDAGWNTHAYGSIFWSISGLHTIHVIVAIFMASTCAVLALRGRFTAERRLGVQAVTIYWQFVAVIWIPVAFTLYILPRILE